MLEQGTLCLYEAKTPGLPKTMEVRICGVATTEQPVIGHMYIVEVIDKALPSECYPYTHIVAMECNLTTL